MGTKVRWLLVAVLLAGTLGWTGGATAAATFKRTPLTGSAAYPAARGFAQYRERGAHREFEVEVEHIPTLRGATLDVVVDGNRVGSMRVYANGAAALARDTELGQSVPMIRSGSVVQVKTGAGVLVAQGTFR